MALSLAQGVALLHGPPALQNLQSNRSERMRFQLAKVQLVIVASSVRTRQPISFSVAPYTDSEPRTQVSQAGQSREFQ